MSELTWLRKVLISDERFIGIGVEFQVAVRNTHGHLSQTVELIELLGNNMVVSCMVKGRRTSLKHSHQVQRVMFTLWYANQCNHDFKFQIHLHLLN